MGGIGGQAGGSYQLLAISRQHSALRAKVDRRCSEPEVKDAGGTQQVVGDPLDSLGAGSSLRLKIGSVQDDGDWK
jgi:hypothetical protein